MFTRNSLNLLVSFFNWHFMGSHLQNIGCSTERNLYNVLTSVLRYQFLQCLWRLINFFDIENTVILCLLQNA